MKVLDIFFISNLSRIEMQIGICWMLAWVSERERERERENVDEIVCMYSCDVCGNVYILLWLAYDCAVATFIRITFIEYAICNMQTLFGSCSSGLLRFGSVRFALYRSFGWMCMVYLCGKSLMSTISFFNTQFYNQSFQAYAEFHS